MQPITETAPPAQPAPAAARGGWIWRLAGLLTLVALAGLTSVTITRSAQPATAYAVLNGRPARTVTISQPVSDLHVQSYGAPISVTTVAGHGPVRVTESLSYSTAGPRPAVTDTVTRGLLTLSAPACANPEDQAGPGCQVGFSVTVPAGVAVTAAALGGAVTVTGAAAADIDSGGGPVYVAGVSGPLSVTSEGGQLTVSSVAGQTVLDSGGGDAVATGIGGKLTLSTEGGQVTVNGAAAGRIDSGGAPVTASSVSGPLNVTSGGGSVAVTGAAATQIDSGGGPVSASTVRGPLNVTTEGGDVQAEAVSGTLTADTGGGTLTGAGLSSAAADIATAGGQVTLGFAAAPESVQIDTGGWNATLSVPGGPYKVTSDGHELTTAGAAGDYSVSVPVSPAAHRSISVSTDGGDLQVSPA